MSRIHLLPCMSPIDVSLTFTANPPPPPPKQCPAKKSQWWGDPTMHCDSIMSYLYDWRKLSDNVDRSHHLPSRTHSQVLSFSSQVQDLHEHCAYCCISGRIRHGQPSYGRDPVSRGCLDHWLDLKCIGPGRQLLINTGQIKIESQLSLPGRISFFVF